MKFFRIPFIFFLYLCVPSLYAQHSFEDSAFTKPASLSSDSSRRQFIVPIQLVGSIDRSLQPSDVITDSMRDFYDYRFTGDLLTLSFGMFMREFGSPGQFPDITIQGLGAHEIAFLYDGIELNDPLFGIFNPYLIPTESLERIEYITGTEASLYGLNSTDAAINIVTQSKKAIHAYSRLRYSESGNGYSLIDGMVSQDIIRGLNITAGIQHTTYGPGFPNSGYDAWNGRFKIRYNINKTINVFFSELFNQAQLGLNGGVDLNATPDSVRFDLLQSTVRNTVANEKTTRHDLQLGSAMRLFPDSNAVTTMTLYLSSNLREFIDPQNPLNPRPNPYEQDQWSQWMGIKAENYFTVGNQTLDVGAEMQSQRSLVTPSTDEHRRSLTDIFGKASLKTIPFLVITPYGRLEHYAGQTEFSYGLDGMLPVAHSFSLFGGYSRSFRFPTFEERYGLDTVLTSTLSDESVERHHVFQAGFQENDGENFFFKFTGFYRTIFNMITIGQTNPGSTVPYQFIQNDKEIVQGLSGTVGLRWSSFYAEGTGEFLDRINHNDETNILPKWNASGGLYYWDTLFNNHLNLKVGIRGKFFTDYIGEEFNQQSLEYLPGGQSVSVPATGTADFVLLARIGSAYIHFIMENLADQQYIMTSFYPMPGREFRFGVSWDFTD